MQQLEACSKGNELTKVHKYLWEDVEKSGVEHPPYRNRGQKVWG